MNENNNEKLDTGDITLPKGKFLSWLDNFWYHYKWHSLIALFLIFTVTICSVQMCQKESYDSYILYAGDYAISRNGENGDFPEYKKTLDSLARFVPDYDGNDKIGISLRDLYVPTDEQLRDLEESYYRRAYEDRSILSSTMIAGNYFLCFFSPSVFEEYNEVGDGDEIGVFCDLSAVLPSDVSVVYHYSNKAIKLSDTDFYTLPGIKSFPDDTLIAIRNTNFSTHLDKKENTREFNRAVEVLGAILSYRAPEL